MFSAKSFLRLVSIFIILLLTVSCTNPTATKTSLPPTEAPATTILPTQATPTQAPGEKPGITPAPAQENDVSTGLYEIGSPTLTELWVNPTSGDDSNSGLQADAPLKSISAAWGKIPAALDSSGYRINLQPGTYPCEPQEPDNCQNYFTERTGTYQFPIIVSAAEGVGTVTIRGGFDFSKVSYLYLIGLRLEGGADLPTNASGNNLLHFAGVDHVLVRSVMLKGPDCDNDSCNNLQEVLKVNQAQYLYVENSVIGGAWHSAVDYFSVQYGHFVNNELHTAGQWCMYVKGGTAYLRVEGNELHDCQLGFSAGQSANFPMMRAPWLQYEVYDLKFVNNLLHDIPGVGISVAGGYNILLAHNTLYKVATSTDPGYPLLSLVRGERGCNRTDELQDPVSVCKNYISQGGWGPNFETENLEAIPNRNIFIYNNLFYNPAPAQTLYSHFDIREPLPRPAGFENAPDPLNTDENVVFAGNVIWNGDSAMSLGFEGTQACAKTNPTCNETLLRANNAINTVEPFLVNPESGDYHIRGDWAGSVKTYPIPAFAWDFASIPPGDSNNLVSADRDGLPRERIDPPGAYHKIISD